MKKRLKSTLPSYLRFYIWIMSMIDRYYLAAREIQYWSRNKGELLKQGKNGYRVKIEELGLDKENLKSLKQSQQKSSEIIIGEIDQDGYILSYFGSISNIPTISRDEFLPRKRFKLQLVALDGYVGVKKNYKNNKVSFINEIKALHILGKAGCNIPAIMGVDFNKLTLTISYILGSNLREELAKKGAVLLNRDIDDNPDFLLLTPEERRFKWIREGRRVLYDVIDPQFVGDILTEIKKIHDNRFILNDIKYGNIVIEKKSGKPYLIDFEMARYYPRLRKKFFNILCDHDIEEFKLHFDIEKFEMN